MAEIKKVFENNFALARKIVEDEFRVDLSHAGLYDFQDFERQEFPLNLATVPTLKIPQYATQWTRNIAKTAKYKKDPYIIAIVGNKGVYHHNGCDGTEQDLKLVLIHEFVHLAQVAYAEANDLHSFYDQRVCNHAIPHRRDEGWAQYATLRLGERLGLRHDNFDIYPQDVAILANTLQSKGIMSLRTAMDFVLEDRVGENVTCLDPGTLRHHTIYMALVNAGKKTRVCDYLRQTNSRLAR